MRLASTIQYDVKVQFRSGFYYAYLIVCLIYIAALRQISGNLKTTVTTIIIFLDPSILGFYFIGGLILLEKKQKILHGLFVTPLTLAEYIFSKALSLTVLALLSSIAIVFFIIGFHINILLFCTTVILTSILFVFIGLAVVSRVNRVNEYLILSPLPLIFFVLPLLEYLGVWNSWLFYLIPSHPVIKLLAASIENAPVSYVNFIPLFIWLFIAYFWSHSWFKKYVVEKTGG